ncbi:MAG: NnrU family protein [Halocynthiibacter sp.]
MVFLILGLLLWSGAHFFKRIAPDARARMGDRGKGAMALVMVLGIVLMVVGYRAMDFIQVWSPPSFFGHINNLLILFAFILLGAGKSQGVLFRKMRHPMLAGVKVWAFGHLMVNGDVASMILFGGLLAWAVIQMIMINKSEPNWTAPDGGSIANDFKTIVIGTLVFAVVAGLHIWLGPNPFGGV